MVTSPRVQVPGPSLEVRGAGLDSAQALHLRALRHPLVVPPTALLPPPPILLSNRNLLFHLYWVSETQLFWRRESLKIIPGQLSKQIPWTQNPKYPNTSNSINPKHPEQWFFRFPISEPSHVNHRSATHMKSIIRPVCVFVPDYEHPEISSSSVGRATAEESVGRGFKSHLERTSLRDMFRTNTSAFRMDGYRAVGPVSLWWISDGSVVLGRFSFLCTLFLSLLLHFILHRPS